MIVSVDLPLSDDAEVGDSDATRPVGAIVAVSVAVSATAAVLVSATMTVAIPPCGTLTIVGVAATVKSFTETFGLVTMQLFMAFDHSFCTV